MEAKPRRKLIAAHLFGACRALTDTAVAEYERSRRPRSRHLDVNSPIGVPVLAVAAAAAFMDEIGAGLIGGATDEQRDVYERMRRSPISVSYRDLPRHWWNAAPNAGVIENLAVLNAVRNELAHPDRGPDPRTLTALAERRLLIDGTWSQFPDALLTSTFAIWCYDVAADAARSLLVASGWAENEDIAWFLASVVMPYGAKVIPGRRVIGAVAATGK
jgi:hypothetical protein